MIDLQTISIVMAGVSVTIAAFYYTFTLRYTRMNLKNTLDTRKAQFFMQQYQINASVWFMKRDTDLRRWEWEDYEDFSDKYLENENSEVGATWLSFMMWADGFGYLLKENLVDAEMVYQLGQGGIGPIRQWTRFEPIIKEMRERGNNPALFKWFEYLVEEMKRMREQRELSSKWSPTLNRFIEE